MTKTKAKAAVRSETSPIYGAEIVRIPSALADFGTDELIAEIKRRFPTEAGAESLGGPQGAKDAVRAHLSARLAGAKDEHFGLVLLTTRHHLIAIEELFRGTIDAAAVHPRVVVRRALETNAAAVILYHNHPSGVAEPSHADQALTRRLTDALALIDVKILDHIVIGNPNLAPVSFAERGWI